MIRCEPSVRFIHFIRTIGGSDKVETFYVISGWISCSTSVKAEIKETQNKKGN
jgi:hypothetical protein